jgi:hypothetical protein
MRLKLGSTRIQGFGIGPDSTITASWPSLTLEYLIILVRPDFHAQTRKDSLRSRYGDHLGLNQQNLRRRGRNATLS